MCSNHWAAYGDVVHIMDANAIPAAAARFRHRTAAAFDALHVRHFALLSVPLLQAAAVLMK